MQNWRIRPSAGARIVACPGSVRVSEGAPEWIDEYNDPTVREYGTAGHEFAATFLTTGNLPKVGQVATNGVAADAEMIECISAYAEYLRSLMCADWRVETGVFVNSNCGGTPDFFGWQLQANGRWLLDIADLKLGYKIVPTWPNYQLAPYAVGVAKFLGMRVADCDFRFSIVQPRRWHPSGTIRSAVVSGEKVLEVYAVFERACDLALGPLPPLNPGANCAYCPGRARCSALPDTVQSVGFGDGNDLQHEEAERELKFLLAHKEMLEARITGLSAQVEHGLRNGKPQRLFELQSDSSRLKWDESKIAAVRMIAKLKGVNIEKEPELITPTQAKKILGEDVVSQMAYRASGAKKLVLADPARWAQRFES